MDRSRERIEEIVDARITEMGKVGRLSMAGPIKSIVVEEATNIIDIVGLDFDADGEYEIYAKITNGSSNVSNYSIYAGDPTLDEVDANYSSSRLQNGTLYSYGSNSYWANVSGTSSSDWQVFAHIRITQDIAGRLRVTSDTNQDFGPVISDYVVRSDNTFGNISRLRLKSDQATGFGVGSIVRVFKIGNALSTASSILPLDIKRAANGFDDEFDGSTLDSSWTVVAGSTGVVNPKETSAVAKYDLTSRSGWLLTQVKNGHVKLRKDYTIAVGESVILCVSPGYVQSGTVDNSQLIGIGLNDNDSDYWQGNWFGIYAIDQDGAINFDVRANGNMTSSVDTGFSIAGTKAYLRIDRESDKYRLWVSSDGTSWYEIISTTNVVCNNIWLWHSVDNSAVVAPIAAFDWIRLGNGNALDPWPLVDGSSVQPVAVGELRGCLLTKETTGQTLPATTGTPVTWNKVIYDTDGFYSGTNPTRVTIPPGINKVRITSNLIIADVAADAQIWHHKNGSTFVGMALADNATSQNDLLNGISAIVDVVEGDYFETIAWGGDAGSIAAGVQTWMSIEVVDPVVAITDKGSVNISSADSPYTMPTAKKTVYVTADGATTINLPALAGNDGMEVEVKILSGASNVTLDPDSSETIEGASTYVFSGVGESRTFKAKGLNGNLGWYMVARSSVEPSRLIPFTCTSTEQVNDLVYVSAADTVAQAGAINSAKLEVIGSIFAKPTTTTCLVAVGAGLVPSSGLTAGAKVYLSDTLGQASASEGTNIVELGIAKSATSFVFTGAKVIA